MWYGLLVMFALIQKIEEKYKKPQLVDVRSGDVVRVHQKIQEGNKTRIQIFEGLVIRTRRPNSLNASILVRRIASGVGVEKGFMLHSPNVEKIEVVKRSKVRRNYLSYMRQRSGKSARLSGVEFDREKVNKANSFDKAQDKEKPAEPEVPADTTAAAREAEKELAEAPMPVVAEKPASETQTEEEGHQPEKSEKPQAETVVSPTDQEATEDKAAAKKAKAEAFRQAQEAKKAKQG